MSESVILILPRAGTGFHLQRRMLSDTRVFFKIFLLVNNGAIVFLVVDKIERFLFLTGDKNVVS